MLTLPEDKEKGEVSLQTYNTYLRMSGGWWCFALLMLMFSGWTALTSLASIQIEKWCEDPSGDYKDLWLYAGFSIGSALLALVRVAFMMLSSLSLSSVAHLRMIKGLLYASIP